jgi:NADH dehydrogenase FAD-containing subunit
MLHEVAAGDLSPNDIINPLRRILRHVNVVQAEVNSIDLSAKKFVVWPAREIWRSSTITSF